MAYQIEILDTYDPSSYFIIGAAGVVDDDGIEPIGETNTYTYDDCIYIEEGDVECFLWYFLEKYFDKDLTYNKRRELFFDGFDQWGDNFFTYESMALLLEDMEKKSELLKIDFYNEELSELKKWFSVFYMCDPESDDYKNPKLDSIERNIGAVIDFYQRFICKMSSIMSNHPEVNLIFFLGP